MKLFLLLAVFFISFTASAQNTNSLPTGRYETVLKQTQHKWRHDDIILMDGNQYKITSSDEIGDYKFSATAQRIIFVSGPLKTVFARTVLNSDKPTIILPAAENEQQGLKLPPADVIAYFKK